MQIVIPGALPPSPYDQELAKLLADRAPTLAAWFQRAEAASRDFDPLANGCTAYEAWQLARAGAVVSEGLTIGAALGPWLAGDRVADDDPVWLGELVHFSLGTDRASLLDPDLMELTDSESEALLRAALVCFEETGFSIAPLCARRYRLRLPAGVAPRSASPQVIAGQPLDAWWQLDTAMRPWRRLLNEIQMAWHEHPVNESRAARGKPPVNGLWLYGGASRWSAAPEPSATAPAATVLDTLVAPQRAGDWSRWLDELSALDRQHLKPLAGADGMPRQPVELVLLGERRTVRLSIHPRPRLLNWLPAPKKNWKSWWSLPA